MIKFNNIRINKLLKIRYLKISQRKNTFLIFLHGFMSDLEGKKPKTLHTFAKQNKLGFLALEYSGHGKSSGKFTEGNISKWSQQTNYLIKKIVKKNKIVFVGSSMGAWITLNLIRRLSKQTIGFVGIGSAPEFLEKLMWKKFSKKMKQDIKKKGVINLKHGKYEYPITYQLIKDGRKNRIFNKSYRQSIKITMIHGKNDESVPVIYSKKILSLFKNAEKKLVIIKGGDHSLSKPKWLNIIKKEIKLII
tara:strand:- start:351 stop:1094 length:744 start_codon:yes stop_codon:yes gene_type:complete